MDVKNIFMNSDIVCHIVIINREISWLQAYSDTFCYFFWQFGGEGKTSATFKIYIFVETMEFISRGITVLSQN